MRDINNRQKLRVTPPPNPIARVLPKFKPQVGRSRVRYTRKGRLHQDDVPSRSQ
jgi:hypothetical protein